MKKRSFFILPIVVLAFFVFCMVVRTLIPMAVLPKLDIPNMVLLALVSLVLEHYFTKADRKWFISLLLGALTFGLLPFAAGFATVGGAFLLALVGGAVYCLVAWLFGEMMERLRSGPVAKAAPIFSALGLYLAFQCFAGIIL